MVKNDVSWVSWCLTDVPIKMVKHDVSWVSWCLTDVHIEMVKNDVSWVSWCLTDVHIKMVKNDVSWVSCCSTDVHFKMVKNDVSWVSWCLTDVHIKMVKNDVSWVSWCLTDVHIKMVKNDVSWDSLCLTDVHIKMAKNDGFMMFIACLLFRIIHHTDWWFHYLFPEPPSISQIITFFSFIPCGPRHTHLVTCKKDSMSQRPQHVGFLKRGYPKKWLVYTQKSQRKMDDLGVCLGALRRRHDLFPGNSDGCGTPPLLKGKSYSESPPNGQYWC